MHPPIDFPVVVLLFVTLLSVLFIILPDVEGATRRRYVRARSVRQVPEGTIRLVGGHSSSEGNVEIYHVGKWGTVCDDEWDMREANLVCRTLGFPRAAKTTHNSEFGRGRRIIWMDNIYCKGGEKSLVECQFDGWGVHDCTASESAGVVCDEANITTTVSPIAAHQPSASRTKLKMLTKNEDILVRLVGGRNLFEGRVEVKVGKQEWGLICGDGWSLLEATVVCRQLGKGYAQAAIQSSFFGGHHQDIILSGLKCTGREANITECVHSMAGRVFCPGREENIAGLICATELPDLVPDEVEVERSAYLEDRQLLYLQCAMEENCLASAAYQLDRNDYGWQYEQRRLLRFTARIGNIGTTDFRPFLPKHTWQWHMCHLHYHSMEVFAHFDVLDMQGRKVAEGHKASFCLEDNNCLPGVEKKYACANYGDQGISIGCTDTYLHNIDCQWVDITDLSPGIYNFKVSINPEFKVAELNYDNNAALCTLYYNAVSARVFNCTLTRP